MPIKVIGKPTLGDLGLCQSPSKMGDNFNSQMQLVLGELPADKKVIMTSMTGTVEVNLTNGAYVPKIRLYNGRISDIFDPYQIYENCIKGLDSLRPGADFIVWDTKEFPSLCVTTFSREAPILAFKSDSGKKALGVILRPALMQYGDYLFSTIKQYLGKNVSVALVTANHFEYPEGSIPYIVQTLALKHHMSCFICIDSETDEDCYHRGEAGNHVVAMW